MVDRPAARAARARAGDGRVVVGMAGYVLVDDGWRTSLITGFAAVPLSGTRGEHPSIDGAVRQPLRPLGSPGSTRRRSPRTGSASPPRSTTSVGRAELPARRAADDRLVVLLPRGPGGEGAADVLAAAGGPRGAGPATAPAIGELHDEILPWTIGLFLAIAAAGSSRNYGVRYLLPLAPLAIVWVSRLAEEAGASPSWHAAGRDGSSGLGLAGQALAVAAVHPYELTYFNVLAGGPLGGRHILADSNLDWGQGLKGLARLQRAEPEFRDLTLYYFGDTDPTYYGVVGVSHVVNAVDDHPDLPRPSRRADTVPRRLGLAPVGPLGTARVLQDLDRVRAGPHDRRHDDRDLPRGRPEERAGNNLPTRNTKRPPWEPNGLAPEGPGSIARGGPPLESARHIPRGPEPRRVRRWSACRGPIPPGVATSALSGREPEACIPIPEEARAAELLRETPQAGDLAMRKLRSDSSSGVQ